MRRQPVQVVPVPLEELAEAERPGPRLGAAVEARLEDRLRQADLGGHAEALVDGGPLGEEATVARHVVQQEVAAGGVVDQRPRGRLQQPDQLRAAVRQALRQRAPGDERLQRRVLPDPVAGPVPLHGQRRQQAAVLGAAEHDAPVGNREQVLPERIGRAEGPDRGQVGLVPRPDVGARRVLVQRHLRPDRLSRENDQEDGETVPH